MQDDPQVPENRGTVTTTCLLAAKTTSVTKIWEMCA